MQSGKNVAFLGGFYDATTVDYRLDSTGTADDTNNETLEQKEHVDEIDVNDVALEGVAAASDEPSELQPVILTYLVWASELTFPGPV